MVSCFKIPSHHNYAKKNIIQVNYWIKITQQKDEKTFVCFVTFQVISFSLMN